MEYGHGAITPTAGCVGSPVLILLLMEYGHGVIDVTLSQMLRFSLNPSFNGIWSWSKGTH